MPRAPMIVLAGVMGLLAGPAMVQALAQAPDACPNGLLSLAGTGQTVSPAGVCNDVQVSGSGNTVRVRLAPGASIGVSGTRNTVVWTPADPKGKPPAIHRTGTDNTVQRG